MLVSSPKILKVKFFATPVYGGGGSWQHFYKRLNASKSARNERREDSKRHSVAQIGKNGCFSVKRARRFRKCRGAQDPFE